MYNRGQSQSFVVNEHGPHLLCQNDLNDLVKSSQVQNLELFEPQAEFQASTIKFSLFKYPNFNNAMMNF